MSQQDSLNIAASKKRSHDEADGIVGLEASTEKSEESHLPTPTSHPASEASPEPTRQQSPPITVDNSVLSEAMSVTSRAKQATPPPDGSTVPTKKRKLNFLEKEAEKARKQSQKAARDNQKAEEAQRKLEEKLAKDEEKRRKEEEKEAAKIKRELDKAEKQKARDAEKQAKEEAKRKKEEEKNKKERAQLRLGAFFQKPTAGEVADDHSCTTSRRSSVVSLVGIDEMENETPNKPSPRKAPEAKHGFLPFFVATYVTMAPVNRFSTDENLANMAVSRLDKWMQQPTDKPMYAFKTNKRKRFRQSRCTVKDIVDSIQGTPTSPIDLTGESTSYTQLSTVAFKVLSFTEDVRPPYKGTYTRSVSPKSALKLSRRPFTRQLPDTNYDYDSEAEWEPPNEDDEDLESGDDESDIGEEADEDMDGFLDDEDDPGRRKQIVGDMTPINSGLCWLQSENEKGSLEEYRMQTLSDNHVFPINPFSNVYWPKPRNASKPSTTQPPRLPLSTLNPNKSPSSTPPSVKGDAEQKSDILCQSFGTIRTQPTTTSAGKPLKLAPDDVLPAFKQAVVGSDLTKAGLVEILKKQFPKLSKDAIKDTLGHVAVRQGVKEADKKWVLKS